YARRVDDVGLNVVRPEPTRQPKAVPAGFETDRDAFDPVSCLLRFLSPAIEQPQQGVLVDLDLLQRLALDARHDGSNEPARQAHLYDGNQRAVRFEAGAASTQVVQLSHGVLSIGSHRRRMDTISSPRSPHSISFGGFRTPALTACGTLTHWAGIRNPEQTRMS